MYKKIVSSGADVVEHLRYFASFEFIDRKFVAPYAEQFFYDRYAPFIFRFQFTEWYSIDVLFRDLLGACSTNEIQYSTQISSRCTSAVSFHSLE